MQKVKLVKIISGYIKFLQLNKLSHIAKKIVIKKFFPLIAFSTTKIHDNYL